VGTLQPGLRPDRLANLIRRVIGEMLLDLSGVTVLTEAATGAYVVTPVIAAVAGAGSVLAVTRATRHGTIEEVVEQTRALADTFGVADRISIHPGGPSRELVASAQVVTNSGHVRPIDERMVGWMRSDAVVALMFEAWELGLGRNDIDIDALRRRGIRFAGTNERNAIVDNFSYLGPMAAKLLLDAGVAVYRSQLLVVCDNPFMPYLHAGLERMGAKVVTRPRFDATELSDQFDGVVIALTPTGCPVIGEADLAALATTAPGAVLAQLWGDVPREWCAAHDVPCVPAIDPGPGHMGVLPSAVGPEPIVRLQAGGLKVAEVLLKPEQDWSDEDRSFVDDF
jgi:hypothetical protein